MEALRADIEKFLSTRTGNGYADGYCDGYGSGYGTGYGYGSGSGSGSAYAAGYGIGYADGYGSGSGDGSGRWSGSGDGSGSGNGSGPGASAGSGSGSGYGDRSIYIEHIKEYNGQTVYMIDEVPTLIERIKGNYAIGYILQRDLTLRPCFISKYEDYFAHGKTLKEAFHDAQRKAFENLPKEKRIAQFLDAHKDKETKYSAEDLFEWHGMLTGSCRLGREQFCKEHNIDLQRDSFTLQEFIDLTQDQYGREIIKQIKI